MTHCLSSEGSRIADGVKLQLSECDWQNSGQSFYFDPEMRIRMHRDPNYCVVVGGDDHKEGAHLQLRRCNAGKNSQFWQFWLSGHMRLQDSSMCAAIGGEAASSGAKVQLRPCASGAPGNGAQDWIQASQGPLPGGGRAVYAAPNDDKACSSPFVPVSQSMEACAAAAEALRPASGCSWPGGEFSPWSQVVRTVDEPSWPVGCFFYGACQGGCGLYLNPKGTGPSCPTQGLCMSINVICQMTIP